jgi:hypothetical protein
MFKAMDAPLRGALVLVRFAAAGLVGLSLLEVGLYVADCLAHHQPVQGLHALLLFLPFVLGIVGFIRARAIAEWIENRFD